MKKNFLKELIFITIVISLLFLLILNNTKIKHQSHIIATSQAKILNHYDNYKSISYLVKTIGENPSTHTIEMAAIEISHYEKDIEILFEFNKSKVSNEVWNSYIAYNRCNETQTYLVNLALKRDKITENELDKIKRVLNEWERFENLMKIDVTSHSIKNLDSLVGSYIELHKKLAEIMK